MIVKILLVLRQLMCRSNGSGVGFYTSMVQYAVLLVVAINLGLILTDPLSDNLIIAPISFNVQEAKPVKRNLRVEDGDGEGDGFVFEFPPTKKDILSLRSRVQKKAKGENSDKTTIRIRYGPGETEVFGIDIDIEQPHEALMENVIERVSAINDLQNQINAIKRGGYIRKSQEQKTTEVDASDKDSQPEAKPSVSNVEPSKAHAKRPESSVRSSTTPAFFRTGRTRHGKRHP